MWKTQTIQFTQIHCVYTNYEKNSVFFLKTNKHKQDIQIRIDFRSHKLAQIWSALGYLNEVKPHTVFFYSFWLLTGCILAIKELDVLFKSVPESVKVCIFKCLNSLNKLK